MFSDFSDKQLIYINDRHEEKDTEKEDRRKLYDKRILPLLDKNDLVVFGEKINPFLWDYYRSLGLAEIDKDNIFYVENYLEYPSLTKALLHNQPIIERIKKRGPDILIPYIESEDVQSLAQEINCRLLRNCKLVEKLNNKAIYREIIKNLGLGIIPGSRVCSLEEAKKVFKSLKRQGFNKILLKKERSVAGFGIFLVHTEKELEKQIRGNFYSEKTFLVEGFIENIEVSPNVQYRIEPQKISLIGITDQLFEKDKLSHKGNIFPSVVRDSVLQKEIKDFSLKICKYLQERKCYGFVGFDYLVTKDGEIYSTEANVRLNASTFPLFIVDRLLGQNDNICWRTFMISGKPMSFEKIFECLPEIFVSKKVSFGIFPVDIGVLDSMGEGQFMAIGTSIEQVNSFMGKLKQIYGDLSERTM